MNRSECVQPAGRQPIQEARIKREARMLADWTGIALSESQEITARAFGATSWQALQKDPTFVPDELLDVQSWRRASYEARYAAIRDLLGERLHLCSSQAMHLAAIWQPTALRADPMLWITSMQAGGSGDWKVLHDFGDHPSLGACTRLLLAVRNLSTVRGPTGVEAAPALVAVHREKIARYLSAIDVTELVVAPSISQFIAMHHHDLLAGGLSGRLLAGLAKRVGQSNSMSMQSGCIAEAAEPPRLSARWLTSPLSTDEITSAFASRMPWRLEEFPGLKKSHTRKFWAMQSDRLSIQAFVYEGTIYFDIEETGSRVSFRSQTYAGVGGLRYLAPSASNGTDMRLFDVHVPGFYLVKYECQPRSSRPIPHMNEALAQMIRSATGLSDGFEQRIGGYQFFCSAAGLALAQWAATFPARARAHSGFNTYTFDWLATVQLRMEFELIRCGALD